MRNDTFLDTFCLKYLEIFYEYLSFSLIRDPVRDNISKRFPYKSQPKVFELLLDFLPTGPHKTTFGTYEILMIFFLTK